MKLIVQIPCFNEEETLPETLGDLPESIPGIDAIETLIIDDGSTDATIQVAKNAGADHVVPLGRNRGLATAFSVGLTTALSLGADVIVNTDGDHQYKGTNIPKLIDPILAGKADMVVGDRKVDTIRHFSRAKKALQRWGSWVVRWISGTQVADATSGFRAFSREGALRLQVFSNYTYTLETIIQAGKKGLAVESVPIETNEKKRDSRLISSTADYVFRSAVTILRIFLLYEPLKIFTWISIVPLSLGSILFARYLYFFSVGEGEGHLQSFIAASILVLLAFQVFLLGLLAELIGRTRLLAEEAIYMLRRREVEESLSVSDKS